MNDPGCGLRHGGTLSIYFKPGIFPLLFVFSRRLLIMLVKSTFIAIFAVGLPLAWPASSHANLITNGSFEDDGVVDFHFSPSDWTITGQLFNGANTRSNVQTNTAVPYVSDGLVGLQLNGGQVAPGGGVNQDFATVAGGLYQLSFDFGKASAGIGSAELTLSVTDGSGTGGASLLSPAPLSDATSDGLAPFLYYFTALSGVSNISFVDTTAGSGMNFDGALDNIVVTQIPEPAGLALAACGLLGLAVLAWKRRGKRGEDLF